MGGRCASLGGARAAASPRPRPPLWRPYPFPPGLHPAAGQRGPASGVFGTEGRMLAEVEGLVRERSRDAALAGPRAQRRDVSPADCAARAEPSGLARWAQADLPSPPPKSPKERVGGCVGALAHHKPHALPGAREARSREEGVRREGRPFPKCFSAPTGLRRACGPRGGARSMVASAPCRRPPARSFSATAGGGGTRILTASWGR